MVKKSDWKPFQKDIIISTMSIIQISTYLINEQAYKFVFGGRFTQDYIENLFSILRMKHSILNALQFKNDLKLATISQYMTR